jgi:Transposase DDE domain
MSTLESSPITAMYLKILEDLECRLPKMNKATRRSLALLTATMLEVRSPNTSALAARVPRKTERQDMREQWIHRILRRKNMDPVMIMQPFASDILKKLSDLMDVLILTMDQTKISDGYEMLMVSVRFGKRAIPILWDVVKTSGGIGFLVQKQLLDRIIPWIPIGKKVRLHGDRFYGTPDLIDYCATQHWGYRLRLKSNLLYCKDSSEGRLSDITPSPFESIQSIELTHKKVKTNIGFWHEDGHPEPWIIAMDDPATLESTRDYANRWCIEPLFSDFKSRGFQLEDTQLQAADRISRLVLIMTLALYWTVSTGHHDAIENNALPDKKPLKKTPLVPSCHS